MLTSEDIQRIKAQTDLRERVAQLDKSLSIALDINDKYQRENKDLKDKLKEAGRINKLHQELIEKLKAELSRTKEDHQYDNLVHAEELRKVLKK